MGALVLLASATSASATPRVTDYPFQENASTFATNQGGWAPEIRAEGICLFGGGITCPNITPSWQSSGGVDGPTDGYLRVFVQSLTAVASDVRGIWRSPPFLYNGASGNEPTRLVFRISRRANVEDYLVLDNTADYTVQLVNTVTQKALTLIDEETLAGVQDWAQVPPIAVDPDDLRMDVKYRLEVIAHFISLAVLFPDSSADFDNVQLHAVFNPEVAPITDRELTQIFQAIGPKNARLHRRTVRAKIRCPKKATDTCHIQAAVLLSRGGQKITGTRDIRLKPGVTRRFGFAVKNRFLERLRKRDRAVLRMRVRVGQARSTVYKKLRVIGARGGGGGGG